MITVYFEAGRRFRKLAKKNQPFSTRRASSILKEMEERAQIAGFTEAVVYTIYDGERPLFKDRHPVGAGQPTNLLFLVQEALTTVFASEPEADKNRLLQRLAEAMRDPDEPEQTGGLPRATGKRPFFYRVLKHEPGVRDQPTIQRPNPPKSPLEKRNEPMTDPNDRPIKNERPHQQPEPAASQEPNQERGEPSRIPDSGRQKWNLTASFAKALAFCRTSWRKSVPRLMRVTKYFTQFIVRGIKSAIQHHQAVRFHREERRAKALDVQLEREKQKARLYEELAADRNRVKKQVESDARREERLAQELKKARGARVHSGHGGAIAGTLMVAGMLFGGLWLWQHPATAHQTMEMILTFKNQLFGHFGLH
ncbi:hypothetical protein NIE88_10250 [Sporolactobacillus shoreicorticis]|uniref:Uncharacterized protein n=1 Tax=Sporolactobacillus shoreicorticis TaxID=1923877 RepID=A0ABW5S9T2_9BACL|nr:hypothetical protein [Sporolactobacillus shoreicorticis]MCO7126155.1 hypothetical protein [Sporolactobacillus shoreicorticis]